MFDTPILNINNLHVIRSSLDFHKVRVKAIYYLVFINSHSTAWSQVPYSI